MVVAASYAAYIYIYRDAILAIAGRALLFLLGTSLNLDNDISLFIYTLFSMLKKLQQCTELEFPLEQQA